MCFMNKSMNNKKTFLTKKQYPHKGLHTTLFTDTVFLLENKKQDKVKQYRLKYETSEKGKRTKQLYRKKNIKRRTEWQNEWRKRNPQKAREYFEKYKKLFPEKLEKKNFQSKIALGRYEITFEEYKRLLKKQKGVCAICGKKNKSGRAIAIDHNHKTNTVRGLLCHNCNVALGMFEDDIKLLKKAITYLQKHL